MTLKTRRILMQAQSQNNPYHLIGRFVDDDLSHTYIIDDIECVDGEYHCLMTRLDQSESVWVTLAIIQQYL